MKKLTIMIIPEGGHQARNLRVSHVFIKWSVGAGLLVAAVSGFVLFDYLQLRTYREDFQTLASENEGLKGEARILMQNLDDVKTSLRKVEDYTSKLGELTALKVQTVSKKTGIGPLSPEEAGMANKAVASYAPLGSSYMPLGLNVDKLTFRPVFDRLASVGHDANIHALELQRLLSTLSQQKSLLSAILIAPVDGWVTSGFGLRVSPFTGERGTHAGIDIAAPVGTPILAPADGVVIFTGAKAGLRELHHACSWLRRGDPLRAQSSKHGRARPKSGEGEQIATVGDTGRATGPHLHYEVLVNGRLSNPQKFILDIGEMRHLSGGNHD